jgi:signal transduction histidine kinase
VGARSDLSRGRIGLETDAAKASTVYRGRVRVGSLLARRGVDAVIVLLALAAQVEVWASSTQTPRVVTAPAALLWTLPLLFRRRFPLGAPAAVFVVLAAEALVPGDAVTSSNANAMALLAAFAIAGTHGGLRSAGTGAAIGFASIVAIILIERPPLGGTWPVVVFGAISWTLGRALAERGRRAAALKERADRLEREQGAAIADERARIARELHDVIAHSVSVMTVQAGAARLLLEQDLERARSSLVSVEETGRQALAEMRRLLGILRAEEQPAALVPQPGIGELGALVEKVRSAGLPVEVVIEGTPQALPPGIDLAAYRVLQEALTNTIKHAGAARARVLIRFAPTALELSVTNDGRVTKDGRAGHGLVGMRERVSLYGGEFEAGPQPEGGYVVRARLPLDTAQS